MASIVTNSISLSPVERPQFPNGDLNPTLLLSPANLQLNPRWNDGQDTNQGRSYLFNRTPTFGKPEKTSLTDRLKKVFKKRDKSSQWSDKPLKIPSTNVKRHSESYFSSSKDVAKNTSNKDHRHSEIYFPTSNNVFKSPNQNSGTTSPKYNQETKAYPHLGHQPSTNKQDFSQTTPTGPSPVFNTEKKNTNFLNLLKSPLKIFAIKKGKNLHRDRYLSECPINESGERDNPAATQSKDKYFHYNTVNADDYKDIFQKDSGKIPLEVPSYIATITPGSQMVDNLRQKLPLPAAVKKSRFTVSSASIERHGHNDGTRQTTVMAQLLKKPDDKHGYNTVGPQDNRDRRPSVSLQDFLEMYKEKNLSGSDACRKLKAERRRSVSQSDSDNSYSEKFKNRKPQKLFEAPIITITTMDNETDKTTNPSAQQITTESTPTGSHSIPEHQEVHHESQAGIGNFIPSGKPTRKNRFLNRGVVTRADSRSLKNTSHSRHASTDGCLGSPKVPLLPAYDHSLTVSGYPRKVEPRKGSSRRMSEPYSYSQKWPELKNNLTPASDETTTPQYRKVPANSLGIDIPMDEFHNKLLVWIDKKGGTKILPLPQAGQEAWIENKDENSSICYLAKRYKCYNVMPTSGKLVLFDSELPVTAAFEAFTFNRVRSAPIWDSKKKQLTAMLTVSDFIDVLLICAAQPELFEKISEQKISDWKSLSNKAKYEASKSYDNYITTDEPKDTNNDTIDWSLSDIGNVSADLDLSANILTNDKNIACHSNDENLERNVDENKKCDEMSDQLSALHCCDENAAQTLPKNDTPSNNNNDISDEINDTSPSVQSFKPVTNDSPSTNTTTPTIDPLSIMNVSPLRVVRSSSCDPETGSVCFETGLISVESDDTIYDAISVLKTFKFHRVLVMDYLENDPLYILTYKRILYFIYVMMDTIDIPPFMDSSIKDLNVGTFNNLVTIKHGTTLREALTLLQWKCVSAIPVLDADDKVVDLYTKEDVMNLVYNNKFTQLDSTIEEILHDKRRIFEGLFKCKETDSLMAVVQYFISSKAHRLVVTTDDNRLLGIISLSDVVNFMVLGCEHDDEVTDDN